MEDATAPAGLFLSLDALIKKNTQVRSIAEFTPILPRLTAPG